MVMAKAMAMPTARRGPEEENKENLQDSTKQLRRRLSDDEEQARHRGGRGKRERETGNSVRQEVAVHVEKILSNYRDPFISI